MGEYFKKALTYHDVTSVTNPFLKSLYQEIKDQKKYISIIEDGIANGDYACYLLKAKIDFDNIAYVRKNFNLYWEGFRKANPVKEDKKLDTVHDFEQFMLGRISLDDLRFNLESIEEYEFTLSIEIYIKVFTPSDAFRKFKNKVKKTQRYIEFLSDAERLDYLPYKVKEGIDSYKEGNIDAATYFFRECNKTDPEQYYLEGKALYFLYLCYKDDDERRTKFRRESAKYGCMKADELTLELNLENPTNFYKKVLEINKKYEDFGISDSQNYLLLGICHHFGIGVKKDFDKARRIYMEIKDSKDSAYEKKLREYFDDSKEVIDNFRDSIKAVKGKALLYLGLIENELGHSIEAMNYFRQSADKGNSLSMAYIGNRDTFKGTALPDKPSDYLLKASQLNDGHADYSLGQYYEGKKDKRANEFYSKAYEEGDLRGYLRLASLVSEFEEKENCLRQITTHLEDVIIEHDAYLDKLIFSYVAGDVIKEAYYQLGNLYMATFDHVDFEKSFECFNKACELGDERPCYYLGLFHEYGITCKVDNLKAYHMYEKANATSSLENIKLKKGPSNDAIDAIIHDTFVDTYRYLEFDTLQYLRTGLDVFRYQMSKNMIMDYSSSIIPFVKAFECELKKYLLCGYIQYRINNKIENSDLLDYPFYNTETESYSKIQAIKNLATLGQFDDIAFFEKDIANKTYIGYCKNVFKDEYLSDDMITGILIDLEKDVRKIKNDFRNKAAHGKVMTKAEAQQTYDIIFKNSAIKKILMRIDQNKFAKLGMKY